MRRLILLPLLFLCAAAARGGALPVEVLRPEGQVSIAGASIPVVSNLEPVTIRFTLRSRELATAEIAEPQFDLLVLDGNGKPLPVRRWPSGLDVDGDRVSVIVRFDVPVEATERRSQVAEYVDATIAESSGTIHEALIAQREAAIAAVERLFLQNRTGDLLVRVIVRDKRVAMAEGETCVRVANEGTFVEKLGSPAKERDTHE